MKRIVVGCVALAMSACGLIKVNVNGKAVAVGGDAQPAPAGGSQQPPPVAQGAPPKADSGRQPVALAIDPALDATPVLVPVNGVVIDSYQDRVVGNLRGDCANDMAATPLVVFELTQAMPKGFTVALTGGGLDGLVVRSREKNLVWADCPSSTGVVPTLGDLREGWQPGHYEVYPLARSQGTANYQVEFFNAAKPAPWGEDVQRLSLAKKLDKPLYVEVTVPADRPRLRELHAGSGCKLPMTIGPQLVLTLERPIPGLVVRPLPTRAPIALRSENPDGKRRQKLCVHHREEYARNSYWPTWGSESELHLGNEDDGTYALTIGSDDQSSFKVTLMIFDASTKFEPATAIAPHEDVPLEGREVANFFPELDVRELGLASWDDAVMTARVFGAAPAGIFVYPKLDLDGELATALHPIGSFPKKDEPLLVVDFRGDDRAVVVTADGLRFEVRKKYLLTAPAGAPAFPSAARALEAKLGWENVWKLAPPSAKALKDAYEARGKKYEACADRVWEPYGRQIDGATWHVSSGDGGTVAVESPRVQAIKDAGDRAIDAACGTEEARDKDKEATRVKLMAELDKERTVLLGTARGGF